MHTHKKMKYLVACYLTASQLLRSSLWRTLKFRSRVVFMRPHRRCCTCSSNYRVFLLIGVFVWLVAVTALFLVKWPSSWYQFCVSLPLGVRTVGLVLFLKVLTLLSVRHCFPSASHVESLFSESEFTAAVRDSNYGLHNSTSNKKVMCATPATTVRRYSRHDLLSFDTAATPFPSPSWLHVYHISVLPKTCRESHADRV